MTHRPLAIILGLGRFGGGHAAATWLLRRGYQLRVVDDAAPATLATAMRKLVEAAVSITGLPATDLSSDTGDAPAHAHIDWRVAGLPAAAPQSSSLLDGAELCVVNPGIRPHHPLLAEAARHGIRQTQEVDLFLDAFPGRVVMVTGTNGKSTTATLIARALERGGLHVELGGNIGRSLLDCEDRWTAETIAVLEISSAQLSRLDTTRHNVEALAVTRVTEDHVDWHGSLDAYRLAKARAFAVTQRIVAHLDDDAWAHGIPTDAERVCIRKSLPTSTRELGIADNWIHEFDDREGASRRILCGTASPLIGGFHLENLALAAAICRAMQLDRDTTGIGLVTVPPLQHRLQLLVDRHGRRLYGNAISTEFQSTLSALRELDGPIHWVGGGKSKDGNFRRVARAVAPEIASASLFGAAAFPMVEELQSCGVDASGFENLEDALDAAWARTHLGESVLFSPAFASFDQFENFRARAEAFEAWIQTSRAGRHAPRG